MKLDIVLAWMKTFDGEVTAAAIQRHFGIGIWYANRIYDLLVKCGHVTDEKRKNELLRESKQEAAEEMYEALSTLISGSHDGHHEFHGCPENFKRALDALKKARGE